MNSEPLDWYLDQQDRDHELHEEGERMKYWYLYTTYYCPVCGWEETIKVRQYTPKPKEDGKRHILKQHYDYCIEREGLRRCTRH